MRTLALPDRRSRVSRPGWAASPGTGPIRDRRGDDAKVKIVPSPSHRDVLTSEADWRALVETMPQIVWITRPDGWHVHFNQQWLDFTGRTLEESLGHGWNPAFHPDDRERAANCWREATSTGEPYEIEYRLRRHDGTHRWMLGRAMPLRDARGEIIRWFGTCTDIHDLRLAQEQLEVSRNMHRLAGAMAGLGGWSIDVVHDRVHWSDEIYEILDYPHDTAPDIDESYDRFPPHDRERLVAALTDCATNGTPVDLELPLQTYAGRWLWVRLLGEARRGPDGTVTHISGALQDITALRRANEELAEANHQLEQASRLKDDLLSMASHELRTPLTPILGFLELLGERGDNLTEEQHRMVRAMRGSARRMLRLVEDLLVVNRAVAHALVTRPEDVVAADVLEPLLVELEDLVDGVTLDVGDHVLSVDRRHLEQIVINLLVNAGRYGAPPIELRIHPAGPGRLRLEVSDHGPGIPADFRPYMWDRFAQRDRGDTRTARGVGLGLPIVRLLTEANGGTVEHRDNVPSGAVFTIELPGGHGG